MIKKVTNSRKEERKEENEKYTPVIIKRSDFVVRHPDDILQTAIDEGKEQYKRSFYSLFLSSLAAGLILGFAAMAVAFGNQICLEYQITGALKRLIVSAFYPLGFIICILSGTQLFTEHTATAVYPILDKRIQVKKIFALWATILFGNLVGTFISSALISLSSSVLGLNESFISIAQHVVSYGSKEVFLSAVLAGWLMAQGGWLILSTSSSSSQIICIYLITFIIGIGGLHHSIVGSAEIFSALLIDSSFGVLNSVRVLFFAILGNILGGSFFVGTLNYAHIRKVQ
jgi:formate/nitrite transporter FocA (FNT family)